MKQSDAEQNILPPWTTVTCPATTHEGCNKCDGAGWYYHNPETNQTVSEMMRDAMERHG